MMAEGLDEKHHGELGMNDRLLNIDNIQTLFEKQLCHLRNNTDLIFSNHRDDIKILSLRKRFIFHSHQNHLI
jgi:hypothetical protein